MFLKMRGACVWGGGFPIVSPIDYPWNLCTFPDGEQSLERE